MQYFKFEFTVHSLMVHQLLLKVEYLLFTSGKSNNISLPSLSRVKQIFSENLYLYLYYHHILYLRTNNLFLWFLLLHFYIHGNPMDWWIFLDLHGFVLMKY